MKIQILLLGVMALVSVSSGTSAWADGGVCGGNGNKPCILGTVGAMAAGPAGYHIGDEISRRKVDPKIWQAIRERKTMFRISPDGKTATFMQPQWFYKDELQKYRADRLGNTLVGLIAGVGIGELLGHLAGYAIDAYQDPRAVSDRNSVATSALPVGSGASTSTSAAASAVK